MYPIDSPIRISASNVTFEMVCHIDVLHGFTTIIKPRYYVENTDVNVVHIISKWFEDDIPI